jgi:hypothetical protein
VKRKKLKKMMEFFDTAVEEMSNDERLEEWTDDLVFETAVDVTLNEFTASGTGTPIANVDTANFGFCLNDSEEHMEITIIHGELFDDED